MELRLRKFLTFFGWAVPISTALIFTLNIFSAMTMYELATPERLAYLPPLPVRFIGEILGTIDNFAIGALSLFGANILKSRELSS